jgi:hypothetical protein
MAPQPGGAPVRGRMGEQRGACALPVARGPLHDLDNVVVAEPGTAGETVVLFD